MDIPDEKLDFAYRYPFSKEAREVIATAKNTIDEKFMRAGKVRVEEDLNNQDVSFQGTKLTSAKYTYLLSYVYSRMLVSAIPSHFIKPYIKAESSRFASALSMDTDENLMRVASEVKLPLKQRDQAFEIYFVDYLKFMPKELEFSLVNQELNTGIITITKQKAVKLIGNAAGMEICKTLPINKKELPKQVVDYAKGMTLPKIDLPTGSFTGNYSWIEKILATPIPDVRHRTVNLLLAPYLVNVRKFNEEEAAKIIINYIERCKQINPDTKVNETYIKYQCRYAKEKGLRPLSFDRAKELYKGVLELG